MTGFTRYRRKQIAELRELQHVIERGSIPEPNSGCWLWLGSVTGPLKPMDGYARVMAHRFGVNTYGGHRISYIAYKGPIPAGLHVLHTCDVRCCVNPSHLILGTHDDNMKDMKRKGRASEGDKAIGRRYFGRKLTDEQIAQIRQSTPDALQIVAQRYGVAKSTVCRIRRGSLWPQ